MDEVSETTRSRIPEADENRVVAPNFITEVIDEDIRTGRLKRIVTRFPPEPNGYLHIGHAKAICLNFGVAEDYRGYTNLRFDDTNPANEDMKYVEAIKRDLSWLGFRWQNLLFASDYFEQLYQLALRLIEKGKAYVDSLDEQEIRAYRGTVTQPGRESPYRNRSVAENLELFRRMRAGEFQPGTHVLRAKIDMAAANMKMRDPILYRIVPGHHYRTGDDWPIYPMYDFAHPLSDALEGVTHSLCTLEFENNREIYDRLVDLLFPPPRPHQYEFARLCLDYTVLSKRKLIELVQGGHVSGWDDPRMPTLAGLRRRGVTPEAIRDFTNRVGVARANSRTDPALLEHSIRDDLNSRAPRVMAVIDPLRVVLTNYPAGASEELTAPYWPPDVPRQGSRGLPFSGELLIERADFAEEPPLGFRRLSPGREVRLRHAYVIRCEKAVKDENGKVVELRCSYDPTTLGRNPADRKVSGAIHWLSARHAVPAEFRLFDRLFRVADPEAAPGPLTAHLNSKSLVVKRGAVEPSVARDPADKRYQFERLGYFVQDSIDSSPAALVFNRIITLKDSWKKAEKPSAGKERKRPEAPATSRRASRAGDEPDPMAALSPQQLPNFERYHHLGLGRVEAALIAGDGELSAFFEAARESHDNPQGIAGWLVNELWRELKNRPLAELALTPQSLAQLVRLVDDGTITNRIAKEVFAELLEHGGSPEEMVRQRGLEQLRDEEALASIVARVLAEHPQEVAAYRGGKTGLAGFFIGQVMSATRGKANPQLARELLEKTLDEND